MAKSRSAIGRIWERISSWLDDNWFEAVELPPGATKDEITRAEDTLGLRLPKELRESLLIHDGSGEIPLVAFDPNYRIPFPLCSLSWSLGQWNNIEKAVRRGAFSGRAFISQPRGPIARVWFHPKWVPVVDDINGNYVFVDLAPTKGGKRGQVIPFYRHCGATDVLFGSFSDLLNSVADDLEAGLFVADKKKRSLVPVTPNRRRR